MDSVQEGPGRRGRGQQGRGQEAKEALGTWGAERSGGQRVCSWGTTHGTHLHGPVCLGQTGKVRPLTYGACTAHCVPYRTSQSYVELRLRCTRSSSRPTQPGVTCDHEGDVYCPCVTLPREHLRFYYWRLTPSTIAHHNHTFTGTPTTPTITTIPLPAPPPQPYLYRHATHPTPTPYSLLPPGWTTISAPRGRWASASTLCGAA